MTAATNLHSSRSAACSAARRQVVVALGLAKRAKADLETVRDTTDRESRTHKKINRAWELICAVNDRLGAAEHELRMYAQSLGPARARDLTKGLENQVKAASRLVRAETLAEGSSSITWLAEADGALSQELVAAMDAAKLLVQKAADVAVADDEQASAESR